MIRPNQSIGAQQMPTNRDRAVPIGSELIIAFTLGVAGWWLIVHMVIWIAAR